MNAVYHLWLLVFVAPAALYGCRHQFAVHRTEDGVEIQEAGKKVLFYQVRPLKMNGQYERAGYVHPLYDLKGNVLTEDGPADHPYHRGIFWAWHQVELKSRPVADGWVSDNVSFQPVALRTETDGSGASVHAELVWRTTGTTVTDILREYTTITAHASRGRYRAMDFSVRLVPLADSVALGGARDTKGYGGFCARLKLPPDIVFRSGQQHIAAQETAVTAGPWMDFTGSFNGMHSGVAVFCHPSIAGTSQAWILRKRASMQNPVFPGRHPQVLPAQGWTLRYRLIIHNGSITPEELEKLYREYAAQY